MGQKSRISYIKVESTTANSDFAKKRVQYLNEALCPARAGFSAGRQFSASKSASLQIAKTLQANQKIDKLTNMNNEKWNEICFLLSENIKKDISESSFEQNVIQALRVLDWKQFLGDYEIRPSYQIGAANRITPDFVIKSSDNHKLFVIEVKQPNIPFTSTFQQQLFSYMRQLRLEYGILIGQAIQIFYDGPLVQQEDPVLLTF